MTGGGAMVTLDGSFSGAAGTGTALPPCGPTSASALALSSGDTESLPACDAAGVLFAPLSAFMLLAISTPPATAATTRASTAHLIHDLLLGTGSCGNGGGLSWRSGNTGALIAAGGAAAESMGSISGGSVRAIDAAGASDAAAMAETAGVMGEAAVAGVATAPASNTVPHLGQNLACGLHTAWQWPQIFSMGAVSAAGVSCLAPQFLQNLALGVSGLLHCEQFIVCNR